MNWEWTCRNLERGLLGLPTREGSPLPREEALAVATFALLMEVEALREALTRVTKAVLPAEAAQSAVGSAYRDTALLTHDCTGSSDGWSNLLMTFFPRSVEAGERSWRETIFMKRVGFSDMEIEAYKKEARGAEAKT
jgi:hypothetical protein